MYYSYQKANAIKSLACNDESKTMVCMTCTSYLVVGNLGGCVGGVVVAQILFFRNRGDELHSILNTQNAQKSRHSATLTVNANAHAWEEGWGGNGGAGGLPNKLTHGCGGHRAPS